MYRLSPSYASSYVRNLVNRTVNRYLGGYARRFRWLQRPELVLGAGCAVVVVGACLAVSVLVLAAVLLLRG